MPELSLQLSLGLSDPIISLAMYLSILSTILCVAYGVAMWNKST